MSAAMCLSDKQIFLHSCWYLSSFQSIAFAIKLDTLIKGHEKLWIFPLWHSNRRSFLENKVFFSTWLFGTLSGNRTCARSLPCGNFMWDTDPQWCLDYNWPRFLRDHEKIKIAAVQVFSESSSGQTKWPERDKSGQSRGLAPAQVWMLSWLRFWGEGRTCHGTRLGIWGMSAPDWRNLLARASGDRATHWSNRVSLALVRAG